MKDWGQEHLDHEHEQRRLRLGDDENYARNYLDLAESQRIRAWYMMAMPFLMLLLLAATAYAFALGYLREFVFTMIALLVLSSLVRFILKIRKLRKQQLAHDIAIEKRDGIDRRFGRKPSERKNENA